MNPRYVVFGEALTDFIRQDDGRWLAVAGGACWNVARVGAQLGVPTAYAGAVSTDLFGQELARLTLLAGLDMRFLQQLDKPPLLAMVPSQHPPQYFFVGGDSADLHFDPSSLPAGWRSDAEIVHFGCISLARQPLADKLVAEAVAAHAAGKRIAFDPNFRSPMRDPAYRPILDTMAGLADFIKVSDEDLGGLFPGLSPDAGLQALQAMAPQAAILLTCGADGMALLHQGNGWRQPAFRVQVADTVGCGDAAIGGWMASLLSRPAASEVQHLAYAAATAGLAATRAGAYAPARGEVERLLAA